MVRSAFFGPLASALVCVSSACALITIGEGTARASVTEPNGLSVPGPSSNASEIPLSTLFTQRNEAINWQTDAHATPDVFSPLCDFTASLVLKQSQSTLAVGWYNVVPNVTNPPSALDIYQIVPAGAAVGTTITGATIRSDPHYQGGLIGFALMRGSSLPNFSESKWNVLCNSGSCAATPGHWVLSLSYKSTVTTNAYYVGFEDGDTTTSSWNNDGDFNDYVFFFTGLACAGAGVPCTVPGVVGACAPGFTECDGTGALVCKQVTQPGTEKCDGVDNDCNGTTDEGDICPSGKVCSKGVCVPRCGSAEFTCASGSVCNKDSLCVDPACVSVTCPAGQVCNAGKCKGACDGVICPDKQVCRVGQCVDPCIGVTCDQGRVCESGVCVESCSCQACAATLTCSAASGHCVETACATLTCTTGTRCLAGSCVPACQGVVCPDGQACDQGQCKDVPPAAPDGGGGFVNPDNDAGDASIGGDDASAGDDDAGNGDAPPEDGVFSGGKKGCGCVVAGSETGNAAPLLLLFAAIGTVAARRRTRRR